MFEPYRVSAADCDILEFQDVLVAEMKGGDLRAFLNELGPTLVGMSMLPDKDILMACLRMQVHRHSGLEEHVLLRKGPPSAMPDIIRLLMFHHSALLGDEDVRRAASGLAEASGLCPQRYSQGEWRLLPMDRPRAVRARQWFPVRARSPKERKHVNGPRCREEQRDRSPPVG